MESFGAFYMATKMTQYPMNVILDEDILDGTLAADHQAVIVSAITYLDPAVLAGLEAFAASGGLVLTTNDTTVAIQGATKLNIAPGDDLKKERARIAAINDADAKLAATQKANSFRAQMESAEAAAKALTTALQAKGIKPAFISDIATLAPGRQVRGEIEYLFAVNFTPVDGYNTGLPGNGYGTPAAAKATISLPDDGRPVYNAISSAVAPFTKQGDNLQAGFDLGPGQMLAFARTARPIGGVQVGTPVVNRDLTRTENVQRLEFSASLVDTQQRVISGAAPLQIMVTDPFGSVRYNLYRATEQGVCRISLPLAANDAAGEWTITVRELLAGTEGSTKMTYQPAAQCGVVAGAVQRAMYFEPDKANIYQFFRQYRQISVVAGPGQDAAAQRVVDIFRPYNVYATIVPLEEAVKPRPLTDEEALTWCGTSLAGSLNAATRANAAQVGYNLWAPAILIGSPQNNPLIKRLADAKVLPYPLTADFPGRGRGMVAWNIMTLGHDVEVIACIGNDDEGIAEAIGTLFTLGIGHDPLLPLALPENNSVTPATQRVGLPPAVPVAWQLSLPDRAIAITAAADGSITAYNVNGMQASIDSKGKITKMAAYTTMPEIAKPTVDIKALPKDKVNSQFKVTQVVKNDAGVTAVAFLGGRVQVFTAEGAVKAEQQFPQDISALAWSGATLIVGLANGAVLAMQP